MPSRLGAKEVQLSNFRLAEPITVISVNLRPVADLSATGWSTPPLWSKIDEDVADGTVITGVAS